MKILTLIYRGMIYYVLIMEVLALLLYLGATFRLGHPPSNESEEARSFGFDRFFDVFNYFFFASTAIVPISVIILAFLIFRFKYRPASFLLISILTMYAIFFSWFFLQLPPLGTWLIGWCSLLLTIKLMWGTRMFCCILFFKFIDEKD